MSINEILKQINAETKKNYAYTTIATVLNRLEKEGIAISRMAKINGRAIKLFYLSGTGYKREVKNFLKDIFNKFGEKGVRHLGELLDTEISEEDLAELQKKLDNA